MKKTTILFLLCLILAAALTAGCSQLPKPAPDTGETPADSAPVVSQTETPETPEAKTYDAHALALMPYAELKTLVASEKEDLLSWLTDAEDSEDVRYLNDVIRLGAPIGFVSDGRVIRLETLTEMKEDELKALDRESLDAYLATLTAEYPDCADTAADLTFRLNEGRLFCGGRSYLPADLTAYSKERLEGEFGLEALTDYLDRYARIYGAGQAVEAIRFHLLGWLTERETPPAFEEMAGYSLWVETTPFFFLRYCDRDGAITRYLDGIERDYPAFAEANWGRISRLRRILNGDEVYVEIEGLYPSFTSVASPVGDDGAFLHYSPILDDTFCAMLLSESMMPTAQKILDARTNPTELSEESYGAALSAAKEELAALIAKIPATDNRDLPLARKLIEAGHIDAARLNDVLRYGKWSQSNPYCLSSRDLAILFAPEEEVAAYFCADTCFFYDGAIYDLGMLEELADWQLKTIERDTDGAFSDFLALNSDVSDVDPETASGLAPYAERFAALLARVG